MELLPTHLAKQCAGNQSRSGQLLVKAWLDLAIKTIASVFHIAHLLREQVADNSSRGGWPARLQLPTALLHLACPLLPPLVIF